ncbi:MAG: hypothetical protein HZA50_05960 [Planctomycetes bacterium]|nr:hypothetical protein [Planctomycetota bacterium]
MKTGKIVSVVLAAAVGLGIVERAMAAFAGSPMANILFQAGQNAAMGQTAGSAAATNPVTSSAVSQEEIKKLIAELGDNRVKVHEAAAKRIVEIGESALAALREAVKNKETDREIVWRSRKILLTHPVAVKMDKDTPIDKVRLLDANSFGGGINVFLNGDGSAVVQVVGPLEGKTGVWEKRYEIKLASEKIKEFEKLLAEHAFFNIKIVEPTGPGPTDSTRPRIAVKLASGHKGSAGEWSYVRTPNPDFRAILQWLRGLATTAKDGKIVYEGAYDEKWRPKAEVRKPSPEQEEEISWLISQLYDEDSKVCETAARRLMEMGEAKKQLEEKLSEKDLDSKIRRQIMEILSDINDL